MAKPIYGTLAEAIEGGDTCPNCNGLGTVLIKNVRKRTFNAIETIDVSVPCLMCDGTGNILCIPSL